MYKWEVFLIMSEKYYTVRYTKKKGQNSQNYNNKLILT